MSELVHVILTIITGLVSLIFILWGRTLQSEKAALVKDIEQLRSACVKDIQVLQADVRDDMQTMQLTIDTARKRCSEETSRIQTGIGRLTEGQTRLELELTERFISRREMDMLWTEVRHIRARLQSSDERTRDRK